MEGVEQRAETPRKCSSWRYIEGYHSKKLPEVCYRSASQEARRALGQSQSTEEDPTLWRDCVGETKWRLSVGEHGTVGEDQSTMLLSCIHRSTVC